MTEVKRDRGERHAESRAGTSGGSTGGAEKNASVASVVASAMCAAGVYVRDPTSTGDGNDLEYVGFWLRVGAALIDTLLVLIVCLPLMAAIYGKDYWLADAMIRGPADLLINWVLPAVAIVVFWIYRQATPGKIAISAKIVDAKTGAKPSTGQLIGRYAGYYVATLPFMVGILWVAFDPRKQGWHDKLAGTVVVRPRTR